MTPPPTGTGDDTRASVPPAVPGTLAAVHGLVVPEAEAYVSRAQLARMMGVSLNTIDRMRAEGMPSVTWGRRSRRFKPSVAIAWAREQQSGRLSA